MYGENRTTSLVLEPELPTITSTGLAPPVLAHLTDM